jgi:hypothetical protein
MTAVFSCAVDAAPLDAKGRKTTGMTQHAAKAATAAVQKSLATLYYIDFRAVEDGLVGHTYIAYGRLDSNGQPASAQYADYHPDNGVAGYVMGFMVPITAVMRPTEETLRGNIVDSFQVTLQPQQYVELIKLIAQTDAARRPWTAFGYNCNDFLADAARAIGLNAPMTNVAPYHFLPLLRSMNAETSTGAGVAPEQGARSVSAR